VRRVFLLGFAVWGILVCASSQAAPVGLAGVSSGEILVSGTTRVVGWSVAPASGEEVEQELLLSLDGGVTFSLRVTRELSIADRETTFRVPNLPAQRACLGLRTGSEGNAEILVARSEEFSITADPVAAGESFGIIRGELGTLEAMGSALPPFSPPGLLPTIPDRIEEGSAETGIANDDDTGSPGPAGSPSRLAAGSGRSGSPSGVSGPALRSRSFPFRPRRE